MDDRIGPEQPAPKPTVWQTPRHELLAMSEQDRSLLLDEKANRLYNALTAFAASDGQVTLQELNIILNPEQHEQTEEYDRFTKEAHPVDTPEPPAAEPES